MIGLDWVPHSLNTVGCRWLVGTPDRSSRRSAVQCCRVAPGVGPSGPLRHVDEELRAGFDGGLGVVSGRFDQARSHRVDEVGALRPLEGAPDGAEVEEIGDEDLGAERAERLSALILASHNRADREALLQEELRGHAAGGASGAADQDGGGGHIGGASNAYLPWISMPSGAKGPTGMKSKSIRPAWPSGRPCRWVFAASTDSAFTRNTTPGASSLNHICSMTPSRSSFRVAETSFGMIALRSSGVGALAH